MLTENEYSQHAKRRIDTTISVLRQMRFAGEIRQSGKEIGLSIQEVLSDAKILTQSSTPFLTHLTQGVANLALIEPWQSTLDQMELKYHAFDQAGRHSLMHAMDRVKLALDLLGKNNPVISADHFFRRDGVAHLSMEDLKDRELGILAPQPKKVLLPQFKLFMYQLMIIQIQLQQPLLPI